jgi:hypothetical protein
MVVAVCTIELELPEGSTLKDKRQVLKSALARVRNEFNVSIAEVAHQDSHHLATLGVACVSNDAAYAHGLLERVVHFVDGGRFPVVLLDYQIEVV